MSLAVSGPISWPPGGEESGWEPVQPPEAVQEVAFDEDQVSVVDPLNATDVALAVSVTVGIGSGATVTVADLLTLPPKPVQVRM